MHIITSRFFARVEDTRGPAWARGPQVSDAQRCQAEHRLSTPAFETTNVAAGMLAMLPSLARRAAIRTPAAVPAFRPAAAVACSWRSQGFSHSANTLRSPGSATSAAVQGRHVIGALVQNEQGVLAGVANLFAGRGYNIDSLVVGRTEIPELSRITIVVTGADDSINQVRSLARHRHTFVVGTHLTAWHADREAAARCDAGGDGRCCDAGQGHC